jgi:hypothetical protein
LLFVRLEPSFVKEGAKTTFAPPNKKLPKKLEVYLYPRVQEPTIRAGGTRCNIFITIGAIEVNGTNLFWGRIVQVVSAENEGVAFAITISHFSSKNSLGSYVVIAAWISDYENMGSRKSSLKPS